MVKENMIVCQVVAMSYGWQLTDLSPELSICTPLNIVDTWGGGLSGGLSSLTASG